MTKQCTLPWTKDYPLHTHASTPTHTLLTHMHTGVDNTNCVHTLLTHVHTCTQVWVILTAYNAKGRAWSKRACPLVSHVAPIMNTSLKTHQANTAASVAMSTVTGAQGQHKQIVLSVDQFMTFNKESKSAVLDAAVIHFPHLRESVCHVIVSALAVMV